MMTMKIWSHHTTRMTNSVREASTEVPQEKLIPLQTSKFEKKKLRQFL